MLAFLVGAWLWVKLAGGDPAWGKRRQWADRLAAWGLAYFLLPFMAFNGMIALMSGQYSVFGENTLWVCVVFGAILCVGVLSSSIDDKKSMKAFFADWQRLGPFRKTCPVWLERVFVSGWVAFLLYRYGFS